MNLESKELDKFDIRSVDDTPDRDAGKAISGRGLFLFGGIFYGGMS